jgi:hypothetical protein
MEKGDNLKMITLLILLIIITVFLVNISNDSSNDSPSDITKKNFTFKCFNKTIFSDNYSIAPYIKNFSFYDQLDDYKTSLNLIIDINEQLFKLSILLKNEEIENYLVNHRTFLLLIEQIIREINNSLIILNERLDIDSISLYLNYFSKLENRSDYLSMNESLTNIMNVLSDYKNEIDNLYSKLYNLKITLEKDFTLKFSIEFIEILFLSLSIISIISLQLYFYHQQGNLIISLLITLVLCYLILCYSERNERIINDLVDIKSEAETISCLIWDNLTSLIEKYEKFEYFIKNLYQTNQINLTNQTNQNDIKITSPGITNFY